MALSFIGLLVEPVGALAFFAQARTPNCTWPLRPSVLIACKLNSC
jgi:hypothetical protein